MNIIDIDNISISFSDIDIFQNVTLTIKQGEFTAIVGPNGSGKSTLLRILANLIQPTNGSIKLFDLPVKQFNQWEKVGYIPQNNIQTNKSFPITVKEIVAMGLTNKKTLLPYLAKEEKEKIDEALNIVGMLPFKDRLIGQLSGGQRQKVFLAKVLAGKAELLLLDEPTSGIDADAKRGIYALLKNLNKEKHITIVMVSHDMELAMQTADKVLCLEAGGICYWGDADKMAMHRHKGGYYFGCEGKTNGNI